MSKHTGEEETKESTNKASSLVHQTDASGNQQHAAGHQEESNGLSGFLCCLFGCCGVSNSIHESSNRFGGAYIGADALLVPQLPQDIGKKTLLIDLDETLVHSTFQPEESADIVLPITIEDALYRVYVQVRPFAKEFLQEMSKHFELVLFTASLQKYADPLLDLLDKSRVIRTF